MHISLALAKPQTSGWPCASAALVVSMMQCTDIESPGAMV